MWVSPSSSRFLSHNPKGLFGSKGALIGALGGQGVINIGKLNYARQQRDLLSPQFIRIAAAVPPLMVMPDNWEHWLQRANILTNSLATFGVALHDGPLFRC